VPALKYALGVVGVVAAVAIVRSFQIGYGVAFFGAVVMFILMVLMVVFAKLTQAAPRYFTAPALVLLWTFLLLTIGTACLLFTSVFFKKPVDLQAWINPPPPPVPEWVIRQLANGTEDFDKMFRDVFKRVSWDSLGQVLELNRELRARGSPLWSKAYDATTGKEDAEKLLSADEKKSYEYVNRAMLKICSQVADVLKSSRPRGASLDFSGTHFWSCDWSNVDLSGANIESMALDTMNLEGANLANISQFEGASFHQVAWWKAKKVSPKLLEFLEENTGVSYDKTLRYPPGGETVTPEQYAAALKELKHRSR